MSKVTLIGSKATLIGLDLAKSVFQIHGVDAEGKTVLRKRLSRGQMAAFFAQMEPCIVAMEACSGSHYWGRKLTSLGHTPHLISPQYVKPFVRTNFSTFWRSSTPRQNASGWSAITSTRINWVRSTKPSPRQPPEVWRNGWRSTTPLSTGVGSISPNWNSASSPSNTWIVGFLTSTPASGNPRLGNPA